MQLTEQANPYANLALFISVPTNATLKLPDCDIDAQLAAVSYVFERMLYGDLRRENQVKWHYLVTATKL